MSEAHAGAEQRMIGRYALYKEIAAGGMATVHLGKVVGAGGFSRPVAIKRLHAHFARDPSFVAMFLDEARLASRIFHPNVVAPLDVVSTDGELFLVMEYIRGASLSRLIRAAMAEEKPIPPKIVGAVVSNMLHGLHAAHEARGDRGERLNIVHRDISPQNLIVGVDGVARVLDFGVAKAAGRMQTTRDGQLKGKLSYMAPEQVKGEDVTRRTDIYAATVVLWEALTSRRLFKAENEANAIAKVLMGKVPPATSIVPGLPPAIDAVIAKGLHLDPEERYATAREMAGELESTLGVASTTDVADWVEHCAESDLSEQAENVGQMESGSSWSMKAMKSLPTGLEPETRIRPLPEPRSGVSSVSLSQTAAPEDPAKPRTKIIIAAIAAVAFIVGVIIVTVAARTPPATATTQPQPQTPTPTPTQTQTQTQTQTPTPTQTAAPPSTGTASAAATATPVISVTSLPKSTSTQIQTAAPTPTKPAADCNPPYTTDAKGHVHYKPQCM